MMPQLPLRRRERPRAGNVAVLEDTPERVMGWAGGEEAKARERDELVGEISAAMESRGYDTEGVKAMLGN